MASPKQPFFLKTGSLVENCAKKTSWPKEIMPIFAKRKNMETVQISLPRQAQIADFEVKMLLFLRYLFPSLFL